MIYACTIPTKPHKLIALLALAAKLAARKKDRQLIASSTESRRI
jgi:hypothetical protein